MSAFRQCSVSLAVLFLLPMLLFGTTPQPVGFAANDLQFVVGSSMAQGHATVFDGDAVRSLYFATRLNLKDGSRYMLGTGSEGTVHRDYFVLRSGSVEIMNAGYSSRVLASSLNVAAENPGSTATVYLTGKGRVTVLARSGEVKLSRVDGAPVVALRAGQLVSLKPGARGKLQMESDGALKEVTRVQSEQLATLAEAAVGYNCLAPRVDELSRSFASLASQLAANQAARSAVLTRVESGIATALDRQNLASLDNRLTVLTQTSASFSGDLVEVLQPHQDSIWWTFATPHTVHGHLNPYIHHGAHGHTIPPPYPNGPYGEHQVPPHQVT